MKMKIIIIVLVFPFLCNSQNINQKLDSLFQQHQLMGGSVLLSIHDSMVVDYHTGTADLTNNIPITDSTFFRVASLSKTVTAIALMQLVEQGLIDLYADISLYFGYSIRNPNYLAYPITPFKLLTHQSSLQDGIGFYNFLDSTLQSDSIPTLEELLNFNGAFYTPDIWRSEPPGGYFKFSNINYGILGALVEKITNQRFDIYVRQNILLPLGIEGSYNIQDLPDISRLAVLYRKYGGNWAPQIDNYNGTMPIVPPNLSSYIPGKNGMLFAPYGGLRVTTKELMKITSMLANKGILDSVRILGDTTVDKMTYMWYCESCGNLGDNMGGLLRGYGFGLHVTTNYNMEDMVFPNIEMVGHFGDAYGLISDMYFDRKNIYKLVFLTNGSGTGYPYGLITAYKRIEEQVFLLLYQEYISNSTVSNIENKTPVYKLYPNPAGKTLYIENMNPDFNKTTSIYLYDMANRLVLHQSIDNKTAVELHGLGPGIYFYKIEAAEGYVQKGKIVKSLDD